MTFWLRSVERQVAERGRRVRGDLTAIDAARRSFATGLRNELRRPEVLLAVFAAGLGVGWLRRAEQRPADADGTADDDAPRTGRIAKAVAAVVAGARVYEQLRRVVALIDQPRYATAGQRDVAAPSESIHESSLDGAERAQMYAGSAAREQVG